MEDIIVDIEGKFGLEYNQAMMREFVKYHITTR